MHNPSLSWQKLQNVYYSIRPCYESLQWNIDNLHRDYRIAVSDHTTLIALATKSVPNPNVIEVYSLSGVKLWSMVYNSTTHDHIVDFVFYGEQLCVVLSSGKYRIYSDFAGTFNEYLVAHTLARLSCQSELPASEASPRAITDLEPANVVKRVTSAHVWGTCLVLFYPDSVIFSDLRTLASYEVSLAGLQLEHIHSNALLSATDTTMSFLLAYRNTVFTVRVSFSDMSFELVDESLTDGPFSIISVSANGSFIALQNSSSNKIFVINKAFNRMLLEYDTSNESGSPHMMEWAGDDAIVLSMRDEIKLIGPEQKSISFFYDIIEYDGLNLDIFPNELARENSSFNVPFIKSEDDGLKIITNNKVEFLGRVAQLSVNLFLVGSSHPLSILLDCLEKLALQPSKADSNITLLKSEGSLDEALKKCLDASLEEYSPVWQKKILQAVSFGKIYVDNFDADQYLRVFNTIKVMNQLRSPEIGVFLNYAELLAVGWPGVIQMLLLRSQYLLALSIVELLDLKECKDMIYIQWCCSKIKKELTMSDVALFKIISKKLFSAQKPGESSRSSSKGHVLPKNYLSVSQISNVAFEEGRIDLCKLLIDLEPSVLKKANQLLQIEDVELAFIKCFQTCDYDLCKLILLHLTDKLSKVELYRILNQNELVGNANKELKEDVDFRQIFRENLFISGDLISKFWIVNIARHHDKMLDSFYQCGERTAEKHLRLVKKFMLSATDPSDSDFEEIYKHQKSKLSEFKNYPNFKNMIAPQLEVLELKHRLSNIYHQSFFEEKSFSDVLVKLIKLGQFKTASKVTKEFRFSTEKYWMLVLDFTCKNKQFDKLEKFVLEGVSGSHTKPCIGFETIIRTCLAYGGPKYMISVFISQCPEMRVLRKVEMFIENEDLILAAEVAFQNKDAELLRSIKANSSAQVESVSGTIDSYLSRLG